MADSRQRSLLLLEGRLTELIFLALVPVPTRFSSREKKTKTGINVMAWQGEAFPSHITQVQTLEGNFTLCVHTTALPSISQASQ